MERPQPKPTPATIAATLQAFCARKDLSHGEKTAAVALFVLAGCRPDTVVVTPLELASMTGSSDRSARDWLHELADRGILELVERPSAKWIVYVDLSVGTPTLSSVDVVHGDPQGVLFDPATEGDEASAAEISSAEVIAFGGEPPPDRGKIPGDFSGTPIALRSPVNLTLKGISSLRSQYAPHSELQGRGKIPGEISATAGNGPQAIGDVLGATSFSGESADRWLGDVEAATSRVKQQVPWPLFAGVAERIAQGLVEGELQPADVARAIEATQRKVAAKLLTCPPGAFFARCMQRRIFDRGGRWRLPR